jgi:hypothetical protein
LSCIVQVDVEVRAALEFLHRVDRVGDDDLARSDLDGLRIENAIVLGDPHAGHGQIRSRELHAPESSFRRLIAGSASFTGPTAYTEPGINSHRGTTHGNSW